MEKMKIAVIAAIAVLGLGALGGVAVRASASDTNSTPPVAAGAADAVTAQPDGDQIQQGDQTTSDATAAGQTTPETAAETTGEQAGLEASGSDGSGGHADEPGDANANHQFEGVE
jgi:hypothetical protein